ncbi:MAG: TolC family protein [Bacteroidales bacterium]|nr:TolC family protein [Bacteroidales bacterium]
MKRMIIIAATLAMANAANAITIEDVIANVKQNNKELKYTTAQIDAQASEIKTNNNLSNPVVEGGYLFGKGPAENKWEVGVSQEFEWPGLYSSRGAANKARVEAMKLGYSVKQLQLLTEAYGVCLDIISLNRQIEYEKNIQSNIDALYEKNMKAFEHGEVSVIDINKLKVERIGLQQKIDDCVLRRDALVKQLEGYNANMPLAGVESLNEYPAQQLVSLDEYLAEAKESAPEVMQYRADMAADEKDVKVAKMQGLPKFSLGYKHANEEGNSFNGATVGVSLPIFENRGKKKAAKAKAISSQLAYDNAVLALTNEVTTNYNKATTLGKQLAGYSEALDGVNNVEILNKALAGGQISLLTYLQEVRYFVEARAVMLEMESEYNQVLVNLNKYKMF